MVKSCGNYQNVEGNFWRADSVKDTNSEVVFQLQKQYDVLKMLNHWMFIDKRYTWKHG
jgi:hypothetical protein